MPPAGHSVDAIIDAEFATTQISNGRGRERIVEGSGPSWDDIEKSIRTNLGGRR